MYTVALVAILLASCASARGRLPPLEEIEVLSHQDAVCRELPNETGRTVVGTVDGEPLAIGWRHTRGRDHRRLFVFIHGVLADLWVWSFIAGELGPDHDLLLIDLPGCGDSDKPDPTGDAAKVYGPSAMARWMYRVIDARLTTYETPPRVVLVGHSLGTMVILRMLGCPGLRAEFDWVRGHVDRAVLLSVVDFAVGRVDPAFETVCGLTGLTVFIGEATGLLRRAVWNSVHDGAADPNRMPRCVFERRYEILRTGATRIAMQHQLRHAVCFTKRDTPDWEPNEKCVIDYSNVDVPCLLISGARDPVVTCAKAYRLLCLLPRAWLRILARAKHAVHIDRPVEVAAEIRSFALHGGFGRPWIIDDAAKVTTDPHVDRTGPDGRKPVDSVRMSVRPPWTQERERPVISWCSFGTETTPR